MSSLLHYTNTNANIYKSACERCRQKQNFKGLLESYKGFALQPAAVVGCVSKVSLSKAMATFHFTAVSNVIVTVHLLSHKLSMSVIYY